MGVEVAGDDDVGEAIAESCQFRKNNIGVGVGAAEGDVYSHQVICCAQIRVRDPRAQYVFAVCGYVFRLVPVRVEEEPDATIVGVSAGRVQDVPTVVKEGGEQDIVV